MNRISETRLSDFVAETTGLHFPRERWADLHRGLVGAARDQGFEDMDAYTGWLVSTPPTQATIESLANHLTVGETYFFREPKTFDILANNILPEVVSARRNNGKHLRIWSAACCTGEEPYSIAMLLHQAIPDLAHWHISILATDINARFLDKAVTGIYGEWSFRNVPAPLKERFFSRTKDGRYAVLSEVKKMVNFAYLNLVNDVYSSPATCANAMDLIFCRNVLMYFSPSQVRKVIQHLDNTLVKGGWLAVSPSEASHTLFSQFVTVNFPGVILYQKDNERRQTKEQLTSVPLSCTADFFPPVAEAVSPSTSPGESLEPVLVKPPSEKLALADAAPTSLEIAQALYSQGRFAEAVDTLLTSFHQRVPEDAQTLSLLARAQANCGNLADALLGCDRWIAANKLDPAGHYLHAVVLLEQSHPEEARSSLQRAVYLNPDFVLAHFALGNLARNCGKNKEADRHFVNTLHLLRSYQANDLLPESDGLTAGRLSEIVTSINIAENVR